jgi:hypothetical protein
VNKEEVIDYLKHDVWALASLYRIYSSNMFACFSMDVNSSCTPTQFSLHCWNTTVTDHLKSIYIPTSGEEEDDDRAAYYGGRVMCQRKNYLSKDFVFEEPKHFDDILDYLVYPDVNSLYPSQMKNVEYAYGKWKYRSPFEIKPDYINSMEHERWMKRCMFQVDVSCPRNLLTSFLMDRDPVSHQVNHNLFPKVKCFYWGTELYEALILGYRVTKVYKIKEFEKFGPLFDSFITTCWEGRLDNPKPSIKNLLFKNVMNSLTGKFGQKTHLTYSTIFCSNAHLTGKQKNKFIEIIPKVVDFTPIFANDGENSAMILEVQNDSADPPYPIYLSAQILANSRVYMSKIMRVTGSYFEEDAAIYYTDTDSLIMHASCLKKLIDADYVGEGISAHLV